MWRDTKQQYSENDEEKLNCIILYDKTQNVIYSSREKKVFWSSIYKKATARYGEVAHCNQFQLATARTTIAEYLSIATISFVVVQECHLLMCLDNRYLLHLA